MKRDSMRNVWQGLVTMWQEQELAGPVAAVVCFALIPFVVLYRLGRFGQ